MRDSNHQVMMRNKKIKCTQGNELLFPLGVKIQGTHWTPISFEWLILVNQKARAVLCECKCGKFRKVPISVLKRGLSKSCGCAKIYKKIAIKRCIKIREESFKSKVKKEENGCHIWMGSKTSKGYGSFGFGKIRGAHRFAYVLKYGEIKDGFFICHRCDTPSCVNPEHLFMGTNKDNVNDCIAKGRNSKGEYHHNSKLNKLSVMEIRRMSNDGVSHRNIAKKYGVSYSAIDCVVNKKTWRHVD